MKRSLIAKFAVGIALLCAALFLAEGLRSPIFAVPLAMIFACAAWMLYRGKAWGGYGAALSIVALYTPVLVRGEGPTVAVGALMATAMAAFFVFAGRSLHESGIRLPWIVTAAGIAAFCTALQPFYMPTDSMANTIKSGERILVNRLATEPARGALVVHRYPVDRKQTFIKRIVGMPGDRIRIENKKLFVNGARVEEPYVLLKTDYIDSYRDNFPAGQAQFTPIALGTDMLAHHVVNGEVVVPAGKYFVLGDNRDNSLDSRYWGFIDRSDIVGKPVL